MLYSIQARAYDILNFASHNFWVLIDENDAFLAQIHGLATNIDNLIQPIGKIGDRLKFYHFGPHAIALGLDPKTNRNYIKQDQRSHCVFTGTPAEVLSRWDNAVSCIPFLNKLEIPYTPFAVLGFTQTNSNTAFSLMGHLLSLPVPKFPGYWQPGMRNAGKILEEIQLKSSQRTSTQTDQDETHL